MPTSHDLPGFILKKEACARYNRSFRQLTRDFDKAAMKGDSVLLASFKLALEDGRFLEAKDVTKEQIQDLRDKGLVPTWYVSESWMRETYGDRDDSEPAEQPRRAKKTVSPAEEGTPPEQQPPVQNQSSNDELIATLREQNAFLRERLEKETERSREDKELTRQLHILLKNMQDRLLPEATADRGLITTSSPASHNFQEPVTTIVADATPEDVSVRPKRKPARKKVTKRTPTSKKSTKKSATSKQPSRVEQLLPTLSAFLRKR